MVRRAIAQRRTRLRAAGRALSPGGVEPGERPKHDRKPVRPPSPEPMIGPALRSGNATPARKPMPPLTLPSKNAVPLPGSRKVARSRNIRRSASGAPETPRHRRPRRHRAA